MSRRALLITGLLVPVAGCSRAGAGETAAASPLGALERRFGARLGVYARDTDGGAMVAYRADERFPMCSTYKVLAAAAVLHRYGSAGLGRRVTYTRADLVENSPVTAARAGLRPGMTLGELCQAAVSDSDNTAANLLLDELRGPGGVTAYARSLGDGVTRLDRSEPALNQAAPGDVRDTTTPRAIAGDLVATVAGEALAPGSRSLLARWLVDSTTGAGRIRAAVPAGWVAGDKTGSGGYGTDNDIAIVWPPGRAPLVLAIMSTHASGDAGSSGARSSDARSSDALVASAARTVLSLLRTGRRSA